MKTGNNKVHIRIEPSDEQENLKTGRKTLSVLQQAASNKENLVGRPAKVSKLAENEMNEKLNHCKWKTVGHKAIQTDAKVSVEDLTSTAGPSENYWEILAETRRVALESTLEENKNLHEQIEILKQENNTCKAMLDETKVLVEVLTEMLNEKETEDAESTENPTD